MRIFIMLALILPLAAQAGPLKKQVKKNTADIATLQQEQIVQDQRIKALELTDPVPGPDGPPCRSHPGPRGPDSTGSWRRLGSQESAAILARDRKGRQ